MSKNRGRQLIKGWLFLAVFLIFFIPVYWAVLTSVKPREEMFAAPPLWYTLKPVLENYIHVILYTRMPVAFRNSVIISITTVLIATVLSSLAAFGFSRYRFKGQNGLLLSLIVSRMLPVSILIVPIYVMINSMGLRDKLSGVILVYANINIPFSVWILKGFFDSIPKEIDEAAFLDGCGKLTIFYKLLLPLTRPGLIAVSILTFFTCWNEFILSLILTSSEKIKPISQALYGFISEQGVNWGNMMSSATLAMIPPALFFLIFQKYFISGITGGSVKG